MLRFGVLALSLGLTTAALTLPSVARADADLGFSGCNGKPTKADTAEAKRNYERGKKLFDERDRGSIDLFRSAYLADCTKHELLALLSFAYQTDGQIKEALSAAELYLQKAKSTLKPDERQSVEERIEMLKGKIKEQEEAAIAAAKPVKPEVVTPPPREEPKRHLSPYPWVLVGIGAAGVIAGAILFPVGGSQVPDTCHDATLFKNGKCFRTAPEADFTAAGNAMGLKRAGFISMIGGGAAIVTGLVWFAVDATSKPTTVGSVKVTPMLSPSAVGVAGTF